jgi:hypothetical protein
LPVCGNTSADGAGAGLGDGAGAGLGDGAGAGLGDGAGAGLGDGAGAGLGDGAGAGLGAGAVEEGPGAGAAPESLPPPQADITSEQSSALTPGTRVACCPCFFIGKTW